ncbi:hypothetical protein ACIRJM_19870 [Streptomyces sp. NPDC102405]|jgi:hypothetical protein|uniref:hypothetical protein n=1 Tax=Streptomyces sp. NPDC102405 TaxID=3366170 RepID=UPI003818DC73
MWGADEAIVPIGQHIANLRRQGRLGKVPERAPQRAIHLAAVAPEWNSPCPLDWQRHHRVLADVDEPGGVLPDIAPEVPFEDDGLGAGGCVGRRIRASGSSYPASSRNG